MPGGVTRAQQDTAGGLVTSTPQSFVRCEGFLVAVVGSNVAAHGVGSHAAATLPVGSAFVRIGGQAVVFATCAASCGHQATGSTLMILSG